jgi:hypothetical protein
VALDPGERDRLTRIETELTDADPTLAERFRRWEPSTGPELRPGWSAAPTWMILVFLVAFASWVVAPAIGVVVAVVAGCWALRRTCRSRRRRGSEPARGSRM